jgi:ribonucleoside-diphosphate reductase alpha chain
MPEPNTKRHTTTYEVAIQSRELGRFKFYLSVGEGAFGTPHEVWIDCAKEGTTLREFMHAWAATFSIALQSGVPVRRYIKLLRHWSFEPKGRVEGVNGIDSCESILDFVAQVFEKEWPLETPA